MVAETSLRDRRSSLLAEPGLKGEEFCRRYAAEADAWLSGLAERVAGDNKRHLALIAVGGYGRGSLCPYSDLDVVLVHNGHRDIRKVADGIWYPVWDEGVHLDHSVRRPSEVLSAAAEDVRVALGLLDGRLVWGEPRVAEPLLDKARAAWRNRLGTAYLPVLQVQMAERRATAGDVAFLLEPDLKESHGGLRDVSVLRAISAFAPLLADYADLASLEGATALLTDIRVELHRMAQREHDKLLLQDQDQVAAALGFADADALMLAVSTAGRQIAWVSDDVWRRRRLWDPTPPPKRRFRRGTTDHGTLPAPADLGPDMVEIDGEIALTPLAPVSSDASLPLRLAATAAELDRAIAKGSLHRLADRMPPPGDPWADTTRAALRHPAGPRPSGGRQDGVARPARPAGPAHSRVGGRPQQAPAQRLPHLHGGPAPPGGRRAGGRADRHRRAAGPPPGRHPPARHRQGLPGRPHRRRHGGGRAHRHAHGIQSRRRRGAGRARASPSPAARHRHPARPRRPDHHRARRTGRRQPADAAPPRRPDGGGQPGHRPFRLGRLEGGPRRRPRRAHRPRAPGRDRAGGAGPHRRRPTGS